LPEQFKGDFRLGLERDIGGNACLLPPYLVIDPFLRHIHTVADREAGVVAGDRERNRVLAVVLLAKLAAILTRHTHGMLALLGESRVIGDPGFDRSVLLDGWQRQLTNLAQNSSIGHKVSACRSR
jgi:hypothetical protein